MDDRRHTAPHQVVGCHGKSAGTHQLEGRAVATAAARKPIPRLEKEVLAGREPPRARAHVFDKQLLPVGAKDPGDLTQRAFGIGDGAQDESRDDGVHRVIGQR
jgi:hypothetical protein